LRMRPFVLRPRKLPAKLRGCQAPVEEAAGDSDAGFSFSGALRGVAWCEISILLKLNAMPATL